MRKTLLPALLLFLGIPCGDLHGAVARQAYLKAFNAEAGDLFGAAVAISGDTVVVGAPYEDSRASTVNGDGADNSSGYSGAAYVFVRGGAGWTQQAYLKAPDSYSGDQFGSAVAVSENTIVIGAHAQTGTAANESAPFVGSVYVFVRNENRWSHQATLRSSNRDDSDLFGWSVAVSGDTLVAGARGEDSASSIINGNQADNSARDSGAAYVFVRQGAVWRQQAYLKAANSGESNSFGYSVAVSGDTVAVGSPGQGNSNMRPGAAYVFVRSGAVWSQQAFLRSPDFGYGFNFGFAISVSGDTLAIGENLNSDPATGVNNAVNEGGRGHQSGAVHVFTRGGAEWSRQAYVKASNTGEEDMFGESVSVSGNTLVVGAPGESGTAPGIDGEETGDQEEENAGAAYVFVRSGAVWSQRAYLKSGRPRRHDGFGGSVGASGDTVVAGAPEEDSGATTIDGSEMSNSAPDAGAAIIFNGFESTVPSAVTDLAILSIQEEPFFGIRLSPAFDSGVTEYTVNLPSHIGSFMITAFLKDTKASLRINGESRLSGGPRVYEAGVGTNAFTLLVTAADKVSQKTYTVTVNRRTPFQDWALRHGQPDDPLARGPNGVQNLLNYSFSMNPAAAIPEVINFKGGFVSGGTVSVPGLPYIRVEGNDRRLVFVQSGFAPAGIAEFSSDGENWRAGPEPPAFLAAAEFFIIVSVPFPAGMEERGFARVRVMAPKNL